MVEERQRFGPYEVLAHLGSGGMAQLFLAVRGGVGGFARHVALKVVHGHLARDASFNRMFVEEANLCTCVHHPNVVQVEDLGEADGALYLAMEYVHGVSLGELLSALRRQQQRLRPEVAVWIVGQMLDGLHAAHEAAGADGRPLNIVHRDISPHNVMVAFRGFVKLIDFGIAKAETRAQTKTGTIKGKFAYMSPEQATGRPLDRRTDLYACGIVLWELLTGRRLFLADNDMATLERVRSPSVQPPSAYAAESLPELDAALLRVLAVEPSHRPATALEMKEDLLDATPAARRLGTACLSVLVRTLFADEIEKSKDLLPSSVNALFTPTNLNDVPPPSLPGEMTVLDIRLEVLEEDQEHPTFLGAHPPPLARHTHAPTVRLTESTPEAELASPPPGPDPQIEPSGGSPSLFMRAPRHERPARRVRLGPVAVGALLVISVGIFGWAMGKPKSAPTAAPPTQVSAPPPREAGSPTTAAPESMGPALDAAVATEPPPERPRVTDVPGPRSRPRARPIDDARSFFDQAQRPAPNPPLDPEAEGRSFFE